jgi:hypothetical protein
MPQQQPYKRRIDLGKVSTTNGYAGSKASEGQLTLRPHLNRKVDLHIPRNMTKTNQYVGMIR